MISDVEREWAREKQYFFSIHGAFEMAATQTNKFN